MAAEEGQARLDKIPVTTGNDAPHGARVAELVAARLARIQVDCQALETVRQKHRAGLMEREGALPVWQITGRRAGSGLPAVFRMEGKRDASKHPTVSTE